MKKILVFLLISAVVYASVKESNEYDDVSLELSKDSHKLPIHTDKPSKPTSKTISKPTSKTTRTTTTKTTRTTTTKTTRTTTSRTSTMTPTKPSIMKTKHPFKEVKGRLNELQSHMNKPKPPIEEIAKFIKGKALQAFQNLTHEIQNGIHWLHKNGYWDLLKKAAKTYAQPALTQLCSDHLPSGLCEPVIGFLFDVILK